MLKFILAIFVWSLHLATQLNGITCPQKSFGTSSWELLQKRANSMYILAAYDKITACITFNLYFWAKPLTAHKTMFESYGLSGKVIV